MMSPSSSNINIFCQRPGEGNAGRNSVLNNSEKDFALITSNSPVTGKIAKNIYNCNWYNI